MEDFLDRTSFIIREGLCSTPEYVSIESTLFPGKFWRHQDWIVKLHDKSDADIFQKDSCWRIIRDNCNINYLAESVSFSPVNYQDKLITKCGNQLKLEADSGDTCGQWENVCWVLEHNLVQMIPAAKTTSVVVANRDDNSVALTDNDGSYETHLLSQFRIVEGRDNNTDKMTISFESHSKPGSFLFVDATLRSPFHLFVGPDDGKKQWPERASWLRKYDGLNCTQDGASSLASAVAEHYYLTFCQNELMMLLDTGNWARCAAEDNFDLNVNGCWNLSPYKNEFRVDLFKAEGSHGPRWIHEQIQYTPEDPNYELWYVAESGPTNPDNPNDSDGDIAIDDISAYYGDCQQQNVCTFEDSKICGFSQESSDLTDWTIGNFVNDPTGSSPPVDHTSGGQVGRTVYYQNEAGTNGSFDSQILSPSYPPMNSACVRFWYYVWSTKALKEMEFSVALSLNLDYTLWSRQGWIKQGWVQGTVDLVTEEAAQLVFRARGQNIEGMQITIAFDDYEIDTNDFCDIMDHNMGCDFETEDTCKWTNSETDDMDWVLGSKGTDTSDTGPGNDHTTQTGLGHYLYIAEKNHATTNKYAVLESSVYDVRTQEQAVCFTFWYHMFGVDIGTLLVNKVDTISQTQTPLFSKFASQGNGWKLGEVQIDPDASQAFLYLQIVAVTQNGDHGEIAIDDLFLLDGPCRAPLPSNFSCSGNEQVPMDVVCDFNADCSNGKDETVCGQCDFEKNQCGWYLPPIPSKYRWERKKNGSTSGNGPSVDHTTGGEQGHYMIADQAADEEYLYETILVSPLLQQSFSTCEVVFWAYLDKDDQNAHLSMYGQIGTEAMTRYWYTYVKKAEWLEARAHIGRQRAPLVLVLEAKLGEGTNIIAVDDISYESCEFPQPPEQSCETDGKLTCANGACYDTTQQCDLVDDCGDGSDEEETLCKDFFLSQFEDDIGTWENLEHDSADWRVSNALETTFGRIPSRDHTTNTQYGGFLLADTKNLTDATKTVRLASPVFTSLDKLDCAISLHMYILYWSQNKLIIRTREAVNGDETEIFNQGANENFDYWFKKRVPIPEGMRVFQLILELRISPNKTSDIFIDDISISSSCRTDETELPTLAPPTPTTTDPCYFRCADGVCLEQSQVCNFYPDCGGDVPLDEIDCGQCDFEQSSCGWTDNSGSLYGWERKRPADFSEPSFTYPPLDRRNETERYYMIADVQTLGGSPDPAILISPLIGSSAASCKIQFWHSIVDELTELNFVILQDGQVVKIKSIDNRSGSQQWFKSLFSLNLVGSYQLELQAVYKSGLENISAVAIDDVVFKDCDASNPPDVTPNCDWEAGLCSWTQATGVDEADWDRTNTGVWFEGTGPGADHTTGSGYYAYFTSHNLQQGDTAILATPPIQKSEELYSCLSFWYHIYGMDDDTLSLNINRNANRTTLWTLSSSQGNLWKQANVDVPSGNGGHTENGGYVVSSMFDYPFADFQPSWSLRAQQAEGLLVDTLPWTTSATSLARDAPSTLAECATSKLDSVLGKTRQTETIQTGW